MNDEGRSRKVGEIMYIKLLIGGVVVLVAAGSSLWVGFQAGDLAGYRRGAELCRKSAFITSFSALESLRSGDYTNAIERLEASCYSSAVSILDQPGAATNPVIVAFKPKLLEYRRLYAQPQASQYPTERRLDLLLQSGTNK
jgi:hypothetical protein